LDATLSIEPAFEEVDLEDESGPWMLVRNVLRACDDVVGIAASKATKILHRKRPHFVPIFDSKVATFYGATARRPWELWPRLQADLRCSIELVDWLRAGVSTPDNRPLSRLRTVDIVIWEHQVTKCVS
jgi:hypothetical protein